MEPVFISNKMSTPTQTSVVSLIADHNANEIVNQQMAVSQPFRSPPLVEQPAMSFQAGIYADGTKAWWHPESDQSVRYRSTIASLDSVFESTRASRPEPSWAEAPEINQLLDAISRSAPRSAPRVRVARSWLPSFALSVSPIREIVATGAPGAQRSISHKVPPNARDRTESLFATTPSSSTIREFVLDGSISDSTDPSYVTFDSLSNVAFKTRTGRIVTIDEIKSLELKLASEPLPLRTNPARLAKAQWRAKKAKKPLVLDDPFESLPDLVQDEPRKSPKTTFRSGAMRDRPRDVIVRMRKYLSKFDKHYEFGRCFNLSSEVDVINLIEFYSVHLRTLMDRRYVITDVLTGTPAYYRKLDLLRRQSVVRWISSSTVRRYISHMMTILGEFEFSFAFGLWNHWPSERLAPFEAQFSVQKQMETISPAIFEGLPPRPATPPSSVHVPPVSASSPMYDESTGSTPSVFDLDDAPAAFRATKKKKGWWGSMTSGYRSVTQSNFVQKTRAIFPSPPLFPSKALTAAAIAGASIAMGSGFGLFAGAAVTAVVASIAVPLETATRQVAEDLKKKTDDLSSSWSFKSVFNQVLESIKKVWREYVDPRAVASLIWGAFWRLLTVYITFRLIRAIMPQTLLDTLCAGAVSVFPFIPRSFFEVLFASVAPVAQSDSDEDEESDEEEEIEKQAGEGLTSTHIVDFLTRILSSGKRGFKATFWWGVDYLPKFHRLSQAIEYFIKKAKEYIYPAISNWLDIPLPILPIEHSIMAAYDEAVLIDETQRMLGGWGVLFRSDPRYQLRVDQLVHSVASVTAALARTVSTSEKENKIHPIVRSRFDQATVLARKCHSELMAFYSNSQMRPLPVWLSFSGAPGEGKSNAVMFLEQAIKKQMHLRGFEGYSTEFSQLDVFKVPQGEMYWDGYDGQSFLFMDDIFQVKDLQMRAQLSAFLMVYMSSGPCPLLVADMTAKGKRYMTAPFLFSTSNEAKPKDLGIVRDDALLHRQTLPFDVHRHTCSKQGLCQEKCHFDFGLEFEIRAQIHDSDKDDPVFLAINGESRPILAAHEIPALAVAIYENNVRFMDRYKEPLPDGPTIRKVELKTPRIKIDFEPDQSKKPAELELPVQKKLFEAIMARIERYVDRTAPVLKSLDGRVEEITADLEKDDLPVKQMLKVEEIDSPLPLSARERLSYHAQKVMTKSKQFKEEAVLNAKQISEGMEKRFLENIRMTRDNMRQFYARFANNSGNASSDCAHFQAVMPTSMWHLWRLQKPYVTSLGTGEYYKLQKSYHDCLKKLVVTPAIELECEKIEAGLNERSQQDYQQFATSPFLTGFKNSWFLSSNLEVATEADSLQYYYEKYHTGEKDVPGVAYRRAKARYELGKFLGTCSLFTVALAVVGGLIYGIVSAIKRVFNFSEKPLKQSGRFAGAKARPRINVRARPAQREPRVVKQAEGLEGIERVLEGNLFNIATGHRKMYALGVGKNVFLVNKHFLDDVESDEYIMFGADGLSSMVSVRYGDCTVIEPSSPNYRFLVVPGHRPVRTITHFFRDTLIDGGPMIYRIHPVWEVAKEKATVFARILQSNTWERLTQDIEDCDFKVYNMENANGMCGVPYYVKNIRSGPHIIGIHGAGASRSDLSFGASVLRSDVEDALARADVINEKLHVPELRPRPDVEAIVQQSEEFPAGIPMPFIPGVEHVGKITKTFRLQTNTKLTPTNLHPDFELSDEEGKVSMDFPELTRHPAPLSERPLNKVNRKYAELKEKPNVSYNFPQEWVELYPKDAFLPKDFSSKRAAKILTPQEAIMGGEGVPPLDLTKSPGFPWTAEGKRRPAVLLSRPGVVAPSFLESLEELKQELKQGVRPMVVQDALKDELLPNEDVAAGKVRRFCIGELNYLVLTIMYLYYFLDELEKHPAETPCSVGLNVHNHEEWGALYERLDRHPNKMAGDYSGYEYFIPAQGPYLFADFVDYAAPLDPENSTIRRNLILSLLFCYHVLMQNCYFTGKGNSSGNGITSVYGSYVNDIFHFVAFIAAGYSPEDYVKKVERAFYSDDSVVSVSAHCPEYHMLYLQEFFSDFGVVYTASNKGEIKLPYIEFSEIEYLKRKFVSRGGVIFAPLRLASILEAPMWVDRSSDDHIADTINALRSVLCELLHYGKEDYEKYRRVARRYCDAVGRPTVFPHFHHAQFMLPHLAVIE